MRPTSFFSLQHLLVKVFYKDFSRKHCKEGGNCRNPILGHPPKLPENNKKNKIKGAGVGRKIKVKFGCFLRAQSYIFLCAEMKENADLKLT